MYKYGNTNCAWVRTSSCSPAGRRARSRSTCCAAWPTSRSIVDVPPPNGFSSWADGDAVDELICAMFVDEPQLVVGCAVKAHDDASLERLLLAAIKNWLIDQAKATEVGKLRRRLQNLLGEDARFVSSKSGQVRWALTDNASTVWQGDIDRPCAAAHGVRGVQITRWNTSGPDPKRDLRQETCQVGFKWS
jgi:hypothetical protein